MSGLVDFVFLIDGTGSMQPCMDALKKNIATFLDGLTGLQSPLRDWRGKVVTYRDHQVDGKIWYEDNPFVQNDPSQLKAQIDLLGATGGGPPDESLLDALHKICQMDENEKSAQELNSAMWRYSSDAARVVIVFTDANYHTRMTYPQGANGTIDDLITEVLSNKIILILFVPDTAAYERFDEIDKCQLHFISAVGGSYVKGLEEFTNDQENFKEVMISLARSVSVSVPTPKL